MFQNTGQFYPVSAVTQTKSTTWDTAAQATQTRSTTWDTLAPITQTRATTWNVISGIAAVTASRNTTWDTLAVVSTTRSSAWDVLTPVSRSRSTTWNVLSTLISVSGNRATTWNVRALVTGTRGSTWSVQTNTPPASGLKRVVFPTYLLPLGRDRFYSRYMREFPKSLVKINGVWTPVITPSQDQLSEAGDGNWFLGGFLYLLTEEEAVASGLPAEYLEDA